MARLDDNRLAKELRDLGLTEMADKAERGWYSVASLLSFPVGQFLSDIDRFAAGERTPEIMALRQRFLEGDFELEPVDDGWAWQPEEER